ncbi:unnamed protein product [Rangifer tarandus platyrhynchus]|uniref:Uncharacterized protein n=1 Tax=Rangifer tarandus platyrhynchus TaxID=3082113 RepID=A0AC59YBW9_RANTA
MRMESSRFAVVRTKNPRPPPPIFASTLSLTLYVQAVSESGCSKSVWTPVLASFSSASLSQVMSCLTSMITTPPTWMPSSAWSSLDQVDRNAAQGCSGLCFPLPSVQCQSCRPGQGGGQSWCKAEGTKDCCAPRLIPKVDHPEADRGGEGNCCEDPVSTPAAPGSPAGSVSLCVRMPLGAMCHQANENQGVSPASQAPLWDQQTECHSNRW